MKLCLNGVGDTFFELIYVSYLTHYGLQEPPKTKIKRSDIWDLWGHSTVPWRPIQPSKNYLSINFLYIIHLTCANLWFLLYRRLRLILHILYILHTYSIFISKCLFFNPVFLHFCAIFTQIKITLENSKRMSIIIVPRNWRVKSTCTYNSVLG